MKFFWIIAFFALIFSINHCGEKLVGFNYYDLNRYIGKTVESLLSTIPDSYIKYIYIDEPPGKLRGCTFYYLPNIELSIYVAELNYLKRFNEYSSWDIELFKKEIIYRIEIKKVGYDFTK
ncbi:MAG: hypothetical protein IEMM0008_1500 [bacterium]|nr:MAG: hypothetical protein IEMM0008_1500 [bacterium]